MMSFYSLQNEIQSRIQNLFSLVPKENLPLIAIGAATAIVLLFLVIAILATRKKNLANKLSQQDMEAIAGDDVMATQLDLARAYLEMDNKQSAKKILKTVMKRGTKTQRVEAKQLITEMAL